MNKNNLGITALVFAIPSVTAFAQSPTAGVRLEAGIAKEEVDGDLKAAMEIYQKVAEDQSAGRDTRSKALLRLAGCHEKLGGKAKQVYEQSFATTPINLPQARLARVWQLSNSRSIRPCRRP